MTKERLDYVTFVRRGDEDMLFNTQAPQWDAAVAATNRMFPQQRPWTSCKPAMKGGYTVFNAWGKNVGELLNNLPLEWISSMSRCDFRHEYSGLTQDMWNGAMAAMQATAPGSLTTTYIRSRPVTKTDRRDVGGHGFRYGSRKSDRNLIYYKRGSDNPCIEFRLQGKACLKMVRDLMDYYKGDAIFATARLIELAMMDAQSAWFKDILHTDEHSHMDAMLGVGDKVLAAYEQATMFVETREEKRAWDALSTEEQEDLQKAKWDVTIKGTKALTRNQSDPLDDGEANLIEEPDDLPF